MLKHITNLALIFTTLSTSAQAGSVFHYDTLKIKAILDSPLVADWECP